MTSAIFYESEKIVPHGDRFVSLDFFGASARVAFEIDGSAHSDQKAYDAGRQCLQEQHGILTVRLTY